MKLHKTAQRSAEEKFHLITTVIMIALFMGLPTFSAASVQIEILAAIAVAYVAINTYVDSRTVRGIVGERILEYGALAGIFVFVVASIN